MINKQTQAYYESQDLAGLEESLKLCKDTAVGARKVATRLVIDVERRFREARDGARRMEDEAAFVAMLIAKRIEET